MTDLLDYCLASMARVWSKVQGSEQADYKQYVEMGDILFHATDGKDGACLRYDEPCPGIEAYRRMRV